MVSTRNNIKESPHLDDLLEDDKKSIQAIDTNEYHNNAYYYYKPPVTTQVIIIERPPTVFDLLPLILTLTIYGLVIYTVCLCVKKSAPKIYDGIVLSFLLFSPPAFFIYLKFIAFPFLWLIFVSFMALIYIAIKRKPMKKETPRKVFDIFTKLFIVTNGGILFFKALTIFSFFFFPSQILRMFCYLMVFMYFGLLSREIIFLFSETMASNTGFYSKDGVPNKSNNSSLCMICTKTFDNTEPIHTLICNHSFHENCIKGWCMIAKRNSCPYCKKGVDHRTIPMDAWHKTETWFYPLLNTLRSFIMFLISIVFVFFYKHYVKN